MLSRRYLQPQYHWKEGKCIFNLKIYELHKTFLLDFSTLGQICYCLLAKKKKNYKYVKIIVGMFDISKKIEG